MNESPDQETPAPELAAGPNAVPEVRYSLPELLAEIKIERAAAVFAMEKLEHADIKKLFKSKQKSHANPKQ